MKYILFVLSFLISANSMATTYPTWGATRYHLAKMYTNIIPDAKTLYGRCQVDMPSKSHLDLSGCQFRDKGKGTVRLNWEHVVPAVEIGKNMPCWKKGGRKLCMRTHKRCFMDMHNLYPSVSRLNTLRSHYPLREADDGEYSVRAYGTDTYEVRDKLTSRITAITPPPESRGRIARSYLYMESIGCVDLSRHMLRVYRTWDREYKPDTDEYLRDLYISQTQGNHNPFVTRWLFVWGHRD
jgi:deoxyribonuclease-1